MKVPIKIEPDRIKDAIVQVSFSSQYSYEILVGYLHKILASIDFKYNTINPISPDPKLIINNTVNINLTPLFIDKNNFVKIQLHQNNSLSFNMTSKYIGWDKYYSIINLTLNKLKENQIISSYNRVGIRYISEFFGIDILDKVKFNIDLSFPGKKIDSSTSNLKWKDQELFVNLNILSKIPLNQTININSELINFVSLIDVDIIKQNLQIAETKEIMEVIKHCHDKQKETFFSLLTDEFLSELNPLYE